METPSNGLNELLERNVEARTYFDRLPPEMRKALNDQNISSFEMLRLWVDGNYGVNTFFN